MNERQELIDFIDRAGWNGTQMVDAALQEAADDRAHAEAEKLRAEASEYEKEAKGLINEGSYYQAAGVMMRAASLIDPYEMRDGQLVRKSDGKPVTP